MNLDQRTEILDGLFPLLRIKLLFGLDICHRAGIYVYPFETIRSPERQEYLWEKGRIKEGKIVTNAKGWESWHQYGLATDIVYRDPKTNKWSWDNEIVYEQVREIMTHQGLEHLNFEMPHFQLTGGLSVHDAYNIERFKGRQFVWDAVTNLLKERGII